MWYAEHGWPVLPLETKGKRPHRLVKHGLLQATTDVDQVRWWWKTAPGRPDPNIGLRTGEAFDVLDIDGPDGLASVKTVAPDYKHPGPVASTGKGYHLLFAVTGAPNGANMLPKLDFRGRNGYIVAPPSIHPSGSTYEWIKDPHSGLPTAPAWLRDMIFPHRPTGQVKERTATMAAALDQLDLIAELQQLGCVLTRRGNRWQTHCPFHPDDTPSLTVYPNETFYCFGCGAWGDALNVRNFITTGALR